MALRVVVCDMGDARGQSYEERSLNGSVVAERQLLEAIAHMLPEVSVSYTVSRHTSIDTKHLCESELSADGRTILLTNVPGFARVDAIRRTLGLSRIPICVLTHAMLTRDTPLTAKGLISGIESWDLIVCPSNATYHSMKSLLQVTHRLWPDLPTTSWENALTVQPFAVWPCLEPNVTRDIAHASLGLDEKRIYALVLGRISATLKADLDPLFFCIRTLALEGVDVGLILAGQIGSMEAEQELRRRLGLLGLSDRVTVIANFPDELKATILAASDLFVSPSDSIQESLGLAILEAMSAALPVVASDWSGFRDLILSGQTGLLVETLWGGAIPHEKLWTFSAEEISFIIAQRTVVDVNDLYSAISCLCHSRPTRIAMGMAAQRRFEQQFSWGTVAPQFLELWEKQLVKAGRDIAPLKPSEEDGLSSMFSGYASRCLNSSEVIEHCANTDHDITNYVIAQINPIHVDIDCVREFLQYLERAKSCTLQRACSLGLPPELVTFLAKKGLCSYKKPAEIAAGSKCESSEIDISRSCAARTGSPTSTCL